MTEEPGPSPCDHPLPPDVVALLPMRNLVLFPHVLAPVALGRPKSVAALQQGGAGDGQAQGSPTFHGAHLG